MQQHACAGGDDLSLNASAFSGPLPWVGLFAAAASSTCALTMAYDAISAVCRRRLWFPSSLFSLNATTITLLSIASKLPLDLSSPMPSRFDQLAKLSGSALLATAAANLLLSVASFRNFASAASNLGALAIFLVALVSNVAIQISTGVIYAFLPEHCIVLALILALLLILCSSAVAVQTTKRLLESQFTDKLDINQVPDDGNCFDFNTLSEWVTRFWLMAHTSSPQYVLGRFATSTASGVLGLLNCIILVEATVRSFIGSVSFCGKGTSDYKWSTTVVFCVQTVAVVVGTIAPAGRLWNAVRFQVPHARSRSCMDELKVEKYWTESLTEWKANPSLMIRFHIGSRQTRKIINGLKNAGLNSLIIAQTVVVLACKVVQLVPVLAYAGICQLCTRRPPRDSTGTMPASGHRHIRTSVTVENTTRPSSVIRTNGSTNTPSPSSNRPDDSPVTAGIDIDDSVGSRPALGDPSNHTDDSNETTSDLGHPGICVSDSTEATPGLGHPSNRTDGLTKATSTSENPSIHPDDLIETSLALGNNIHTNDSTEITPSSASESPSSSVHTDGLIETSPASRHPGICISDSTVTTPALGHPRNRIDDRNEATSTSENPSIHTNDSTVTTPALMDRDFVLHLEGEKHLVDMMKQSGLERGVGWFAKGESSPPNHLIELLKHSAFYSGIQAVLDFDDGRKLEVTDSGHQAVHIYDDNNHAHPLTLAKPSYNWGMPLVTLTALAVTLRSARDGELESLLLGVNEGFVYVRLVERHLDERGLCNMTDAATKLWQGLDLHHRWLDMDLHGLDLSGKDHIRRLRDERASEILAKRNIIEDTSPPEWPEDIVARSCMYRACSTIWEGYDDRYQTDDSLFKWLRTTISNILWACLTNLPRVIDMECACTEAEVREKKVRKAVVTLGKVKEILQMLGDETVAGSYPGNKQDIDEWCRSQTTTHPSTSFSSNDA